MKYNVLVLTFLFCLVQASGLFYLNQAHAKEFDEELVTRQILTELKKLASQKIVVMSVMNQNQKHASLTQEGITELDDEWRQERTQVDQSLISATLTNPLSAYLTRVQARSKGIYGEIFVMDDKGLNVGQSAITSDFWQGDEDKFQQTFPLGGEAVFIDEPEFNDETKSWNAQISMSVSDPDAPEKAIGAITVEVNLTEIQRRHSYHE